MSNAWKITRTALMCPMLKDRSMNPSSSIAQFLMGLLPEQLAERKTPRPARSTSADLEVAECGSRELTKCHIGLVHPTVLALPEQGRDPVHSGGHGSHWLPRIERCSAAREVGLECDGGFGAERNHP